MIPNKVKKNGTIIEDEDFSSVIMAHVLKGVSKDEITDQIRPCPPLPRIGYTDFDLAHIPLKMSKKKAMGPDLIPDPISAGRDSNMKREFITKDFLTHSIDTAHCRSRLMLLNKSKDPIPDIGDLRPI